eukprot:TRINITY_DN67602_c10_g2_i3.p1 TRINITY_DN67602_c10_g2~~TRINITY_DN67602_c10_g2_i3.p1  ORF type:complete len:253 (-),score=46.61 TRINITY_DN67602_c10_g2_i3:73-732(-)
MYNGTQGTKKERKQQHKQHTNKTGPTTLKPVDTRLRTCRKALMCADLRCWLNLRGSAWYTPGGGEPVVTPPKYAQQVQDARDKQTHRSGIKTHNTSVPQGVADFRSMKNTYEFVLPLCVISIPDDLETQRVNLQREWYPKRVGWPGAQSAPPVQERTKPPTVFGETSAGSLPDNTQEAESMHSNQRSTHAVEVGHKKDKHTQKKKAQARKSARDVKTAL